MAYLLWGSFPLYFPLLEPAGAGEILAHRVLWTMVVCSLLLVCLRRPLPWRDVGVRRLGLLSLAAVLIAVNWVVYIAAVNAGHVVEASLGYFVNPLVSVVFGVVLLGERLRRLQWWAVGIATVAVLVLTLDSGRPPWIALTLAFSFGGYALAKKKAAVEPVASLAVETAVLSPAALVFLVVAGITGSDTFTSHGPGHAALLLSAGIVTACPLLLFGAATNRVPLTVMGLLQYVTPVVQFLIGVLVRHEHMPASRWAGFGLVWLALLVFSAEALGHLRKAGVTRRSELGQRAAPGAAYAVVAGPLTGAATVGAEPQRQHAEHENTEKSQKKSE